jgi:hypothetical protein
MQRHRTKETGGSDIHVDPIDLSQHWERTVASQTEHMVCSLEIIRRHLANMTQINLQL